MWSMELTRLCLEQDRNRVVLTMDDLSLALGEHGVNVKKPDYCESAGMCIRDPLGHCS